jgi:hypothetical protein
MFTRANRKTFKSTGAPSFLSKLPPELCEHIFSFACLDDGYSGRSLSLVSKYISATSKPVRLQSLVVRNLPQALALAAILEATALHHRRVHNLCVLCDYQQLYTAAISHANRMEHGDRTAASFVGRVTSILSPFRQRSERQYSNETIWDSVLKKSIRYGNSFSPTIEEMMRLALNRILNTIASSLQILTIFIQTPRGDVTLRGSPALPSLRELAIIYRCEYYPKIPTKLLDTFQPLTSLKRLNLVQFESGYGPLDLVGQIQRLAPSLTHVRLPNAVVGWNRWLDLNTNLNPTHAGHRPRLHLPLTIEKIFIQPPVPPSIPGPAQRYYEVTLEECRVLAVNDSRIVLERPLQLSWNFDAKEAEGEWLERINDGDRRTDDGMFF